jgi:hypothetical protein
MPAGGLDAWVIRAGVGGFDVATSLVVAAAPLVGVVDGKGCVGGVGDEDFGC